MLCLYFYKELHFSVDLGKDGIKCLGHASKSQVVGVATVHAAAVSAEDAEDGLAIHEVDVLTPRLGIVVLQDL